MFGLTFEKLLIIGLIAVFLLGPERLPHYAGQLAKLVRNLRNMANNAKDRMRDEMGPEFDEVDWKKLDPRQYDPRRIIRDALLEDDDEPRITRPDPDVTPTAVIEADAAEPASDSAEPGADAGVTAGSAEGVDAPSSEVAAVDAETAASGDDAPADRSGELVTAANVMPPFDSEAT